MTIIKIIDTFTFYGFDVVLLAALTAIFVQILKATLLRRVQKKILTFLPFAVGTVFYAVYIAVKNLSFSCLAENYTGVLEHGLSVGAVATLLYVLYEQFVREKSTVSTAVGVISHLLEGYVPKKSIQRVAKLIDETITADATGEGATRTAEIISANSEKDVSETDVNLLSRLIVETLARIS